jgi:hypothetical protein
VNTDTGRWHAHALVQKWTDDQVAWVRTKTGILRPSGDLLAEYITPEVVEADGNLLTTAGLTRLTSLLTGGGGQAATSTATRLGVGDGSTGALVGDTDLSAASGSTHRYFQVMDATYPSVSGGTITCKSTYDSSTANFNWAEWGIDVGSPTVSAGTTVNACLLNHKTSAALGTKSGGTWSLTASISIS